MGNLFNGSSVNHNRDELMIVLIPHIIRRPEITAENLRTIAVGTETLVHLNRAPQPQETPAAQPPAWPEIQPPAARDAAGAGDRACGQVAPPAPPAAGLPPATAPPLAPGAEPPPTGGPSTPEFTGPTMVYFKPGHVDAAAGSNFTVSVALDNGLDVASAPMIIEFNPKLLRLNDIELGGLLLRAAGGRYSTRTFRTSAERPA